MKAPTRSIAIVSEPFARPQALVITFLRRTELKVVERNNAPYEFLPFLSGRILPLSDETCFTCPAPRIAYRNRVFGNSPLWKLTIMAHHKRKGPKSTRAGCLLCKPHKRQGAPKTDRQKFSQRRDLAGSESQIREELANRNTHNPGQ